MGRFIKREHSKTSAGFVGVVLGPEQAASLEGLALWMGTSRGRAVAASLWLLERVCRQQGPGAARLVVHQWQDAAWAGRRAGRDADRARRQQVHEEGRARRLREEQARQVCRLRLEMASRVGRCP